jgi:hypothetical protein
VTPYAVCTVHIETRSAGFLIELQNQGRWVSQFEPQNRQHRFGDLGLKTDSSGLVIWALKSLRRFLDLCLKIKRASVCRLCHKTDGGRSAWDTRRDLAVCFGAK